MTIRPRNWIAQAFAASALAFGMAGTASAQSDWDKLVEAAKAEGEVNCYCSSFNDVMEPIAKQMQEEYGIRVNISGGRGNEVSARVRAEQAASRYLGDIAMNSTSTLYAHNSEGAFDPIGIELPRFADMPDRFERHPEYFPVYIATYGVTINTDMVPPEEEPQTWDDLLDPKWKGQMILDDPRAISAGNGFFRATAFTFGMEYQEAFAAQEPVITVDYGGSERRVALGEYPILVPGAMKFYLDNLAEGSPLPIKLITPKPGVPGFEFSIGLLKNAPHPNAARLLMNQFLTVQGQLSFVEAGYTPIMPDAISQLPEDIKAVMDVDMLDSPPAQDVPRYRELAVEVYGETATNK